MPDFSRWRPHPWHGLTQGDEAPRVVNAYIEITPFDLIKYEIDKASGYLRVDRPQRTSSQPPALYGFIPRTYCAEKIAALAGLSERPIARAEVLIPARVIGGLQLIDRGEADDKIIAVVEGDFVWGNATEIANLPPIMVERLQHYFQTYKLVPGAKPQITVQRVYGVEHAAKVVEASIEDYRALLAGA